MKDLLDRIILLEKAEIFSQLELEELEQIAGILEEEDYEEGEILFRQGDLGNSGYLVLSGKVEIFLPHKKEEQIIATMAPGDFFGEMALLDGESRSAGARCTEPSRLFTLERVDFLRVLKRYPSISMGMISVFSSRLRSNNKRLTGQQKALKEFQQVFRNNKSLFEEKGK